MAEVERLDVLAPLHNRRAALVLRAAQERLNNSPAKAPDLKLNLSGVKEELAKAGAAAGAAVSAIGTPFEQLHTSPILAVNCLSFCLTDNSPSVRWQTMSFIIWLSGVLAPGWMTMSRIRTFL